MTMLDNRCPWGCTSSNMQKYHDFKWGKPEHDDRELFAMLCLEGAQAGLSWATILDREDNYRKAFDEFDPQIVAQYSEEKLEELRNDPGIIRNRLKIQSVVMNAQAFLRVQEEFGSFDRYIWSFTDGKVIDNHLKKQSDMPAETELSKAISKDLKKRGFKFVGPTIIYSYMQAVGIVNDHIELCPCRDS